MISGFQAREFGLELADKLTPAILDIVNNNTRRKNNISEDDAMIVNSTKEKNLIDDPSLHFLTQVQSDMVIGLIATYSYS